MSTTDDKIKFAEKAYRIRHKTTGLYYCPNPQQTKRARKDIPQRWQYAHLSRQLHTYADDRPKI